MYAGSVVSQNVARWTPDASAPSCGTLIDPAARGTVGLSVGGPFDVLRINGSTGVGHRVNVSLNQSFTFTVDQPTVTPYPAAFAIFGFVGLPVAADITTLPIGLGTMSFAPCPLAGTDPRLFVLADSLGVPTCAPLTAATPAPWSLAISTGLPIPISLAFQGLISDPLGPFGLSITNAVVLHIN